MDGKRKTVNMQNVPSKASDVCPAQIPDRCVQVWETLGKPEKCLLGHSPFYWMRKPSSETFTIKTMSWSMKLIQSVIDSEDNKKSTNNQICLLTHPII